MSPSAAIPYVDTSALAKWYLNEAFSDEVEAYLLSFPHVAVSSLTVVEFRCLLARRRRQRELSVGQEQECHALFEQDVSEGHLRVVAVEDAHAHAAVRLIEMLPDHPLRTLDALHLAVARAAGLEVLATADRQMAEAAEAQGWEVQRFLPD